jgi:gas vesicle protein
MSQSREQCGSIGVLAWAFVAGALVGAGTALLLAPESGRSMRRRLAQGAKAAQEELTDVATETREAFGALTKDARQTLRQTASRFTAALGATRDAIKGEVETMTSEPVARKVSSRKS